LPANPRATGLIQVCNVVVLGNTGRKTGFWLEEFAAPYFVFRDTVVELTLASPKGGQPPVDPKSDLPENQTAAMARFKKDPRAQKDLAQTVKLDTIKAEDYDTIFYVGGHGPMWDLAESSVSIAYSSLSTIPASRLPWYATRPASCTG
jgi:putative intracellular protease/amidase